MYPVKLVLGGHPARCDVQNHMRECPLKREAAVPAVNILKRTTKALIVLGCEETSERGRQVRCFQMVSAIIFRSR